jgi:hypothetical protein
MAQNVNQFAQAPILGQLDLETQGTVITVRVSANQATALVAGQPFKVENSAGGVPAVLALATAGDPVHGFIVRNLKDQNFITNARAEAALDGSIMYMNSGGAISRFGAVEVVQATPGNVVASGGVNPVIGLAFDQATAANQLIRVLIKVPGTQTVATSRQEVVTATLAQINAGLVLIPAVAGKAITVSNVVARVTGAFASGTSVELESSATAVAVETIAEAGLTNGAVLFPTSANVTLGAGFAAALPAEQTGGTSITFTITYTQG